MEEKKVQSNMSIWKPVMVFYAKTTSWIIAPLLLVIILNKFFFKIETNDKLFLILLALGFGISCRGIYKEIKKYKDSLDKK
ncbi:MAG: hypothetical protein NTZ44_03990 [Candidatus Nomurabacteria bacterium]|nr:hypothetical protein [Candidatus Nomurabacteria bacterium]